jgi:hypothetical protein
MQMAIFEVIFEGACYYLGRAIVFVISGGRWRCDSLGTDVPKKQRRWLGLLRYGKCGARLTSEGTTAIGAAFFASGAVLWAIVINGRGG